MKLFGLPNKAVKQQNPQNPQRENDQSRFKEIIHAVKVLASEKTGVVEKSMVYDFAMWALGRQIIADSMMSFIKGKEVIENRCFDLRSFLNVPQNGLPETDIDIAQYLTYTGPWNANRFPDCVMSIAARGFHDDHGNTHGIYYPELRFGVTISGRHHTTWAIFMGECVTTLRVVSLKDHFPFLSTDGVDFRYTANGTTLANQAADYRFAAMYRLAQIKWENGYPDTVLCDVKENRSSIANMLAHHMEIVESKELERAWQGLYTSNAETRTQLYAQKQETSYWKEQAKAKDKRIKELEQLLSSK